jgi:hypothetical protein
VGTAMVGRAGAPYLGRPYQVPACTTPAGSGVVAPVVV